jgi:hypothetical protein
VFVYLGVLALIFGQAGLYAAQSSASSESPTPATGWTDKLLGKRPDPHPIAVLMADAEASYRDTLARQSKTLKDAVKEYQRRYGRNPPKGFNLWWEFATQNGVVLLDEYNSITEDLKPFWKLSGEEFRERVGEVSDLSSTASIHTSLRTHSVPGWQVSINRSGSYTIRKGHCREPPERRRGHEWACSRLHGHAGQVRGRGEPCMLPSLLFCTDFGFRSFQTWTLLSTHG